MKFLVMTWIESDNRDDAEKAREEMAASLEDARESGHLPTGVTVDVGDLREVFQTPKG